MKPEPNRFYRILELFQRYSMHLHCTSAETIFMLMNVPFYIIQTDIEAVQNKFSELFGVAKLITNTDFLLKLRNIEMPDRNVMKKFLEFLTQHIKFDVSRGRCTDSHIFVIRILFGEIQSIFIYFFFHLSELSQGIG